MPWRRSCAVRGIVPPVKRLVLIVLMLILPVQYTWSAAAVYCQHEQASPFHFGHHAHEHKAKADHPDGHKGVQTADNDCEYCHFFSHAFFVPFDAAASTPPELPRFWLHPTTYTSHIAERPPRPNWPLVA